MSIDKVQLTEQVITPVLVEFGLYSKNAVDLLLATCAQESHLGTYLMQRGGPALGIYQMEPHTHHDIVKNVLLAHEKRFLIKMTQKYGITNFLNQASRLIWDLSYSTLFCRFQYWRYPEGLPGVGDIKGLFEYWKTYYNRNPNAGDFSQFEENYNRYVKEN